MTARAIVKSLGGMWRGSYGLARCPSHDDRKPSLMVKDDPRKKDGVDVHCYAGCDWRPVKAELVRQGLLEGHAQSVTAPQRRSNPNRPPKTVSDRKPLLSADDATNLTGPNRHTDADEQDRIAYALKLWDQSVPLKGLAYRYFGLRRKLHIGKLGDLSHALRWHEGISAVVALMTDPVSNEPIGVHRTFLNPDGTKRERKMLGKTGVIRLSRNEDVHEGLGLTEGIEDGLAVLLSGWSPVWAASCAGAIKNFPVLAGIESLTIFSDYDQAGMDAAVTCADRWEAAGRQVAIQEQEQS